MEDRPVGVARNLLMYSARMSDAVSTATTIEPARRVRGCLRVPGDKSISHRYAILAALADGTSTLHGYAPGADCRTTLECLRELGVALRITRSTQGSPDPTVTVDGLGLGGLRPFTAELDAGNSGTTMRLLAGVLAAHPFVTRLTGDVSLRQRPMQRIVGPLETMGARIETAAGRPPLTIHGGTLHGIEYVPEIPSAQVKSAILLAGLHADGDTFVKEPTATRDHTERALSAFGIDVQQDDRGVGLVGGQRLTGTTLRVPGDCSAVAFWAAAAASLPGSEVEITDVGLNPTRTAFLDVLRAFGAEVSVEVSGTAAGEPFGTVRVRHHDMRPLLIGPDDVPGLIDELPALAALAARGGDLEVKGATELRRKESDRIAVLTSGFRQLGGSVDEFPDGFHVHGTPMLTGGTVDAAGDHRMAMAFAVAALGASGPSTITGHDVVDVSYPGFFDTLASICQ